MIAPAQGHICPAHRAPIDRQRPISAAPPSLCPTIRPALAHVASEHHHASRCGSRWTPEPHERRSGQVWEPRESLRRGWGALARVCNLGTANSEFVASDPRSVTSQCMCLNTKCMASQRSARARTVVLDAYRTSSTRPGACYGARSQWF